MAPIKTPVEDRSQKACVFIVDDHPVVRQGLTALINQEGDLQVCGDAADSSQAMDRIVQVKPDIAVIDLSLGDDTGLDLIRRVKGRLPDLNILVLSMHHESFYAERVLRAGGRGYIMKEEPPQQILAAIRKVLEGEIYLSDDMSARLLSTLFESSQGHSASLVDRLSDRELQVFELIGRGLRTREVAEKLYLSIKTVESHRANIKKKLGLKHTNEFVQQAVRWVEYGKEEPEETAGAATQPPVQ